MGNKKTFTDDEKTDIINLYVEKLESLGKIANKYCCDNSVIRRILIESKINVVSGSPFSLKYWIKRGLSEEEANLKLKKIKPINIEYWIDRGYTVDDAKFQIELHLMNTERAYIKVYGETEGPVLFKKQKQKQGKFNSKRSVEYWVSRGFSIEDAKEHVRSSQNKFSLTICIEKYGESLGKQIFEERQNKWQTTLNNKPLSEIIQINKNKDSKSVLYFKKKYGINWVDEYCKRFNVDEDLKNIVLTCSTEDEIVQYFINSVDFNIKRINKIIKSKLFQGFFNYDAKHILKSIIAKYNININSFFGCKSSINGIITNSTGEYEILKFLIEKNIEFIYDEKYPNQDKTQIRYDFYLPEIDTYFEYCGMLKLNDSKNIAWGEIKQKYKNKIKQKNQFCFKQKLNCFFSSDFNEIINNINTKYEEKNNIGECL